MFSVFFVSSVVAVVFAAQQPTFRAGIDLLTVDASVVDDKGRVSIDYASPPSTARDALVSLTYHSASAFAPPVTCSSAT